MILLLIVLSVLRKNKKGTWSRLKPSSYYNDLLLVQTSRKRRKKTGLPNEDISSDLIKEPPKDSKGETECRRVLEKIFGRPFNKIRPDFLRNPVTSDERRDNNLELDCYNSELRLCIEFQGSQHDFFKPFFHKSKEAFYNQRYRDELKKRMCKDTGITLIEVSYKVKLEDIEEYLRNELIRLGFEKYFDPNYRY